MGTGPVQLTVDYTILINSPSLLAVPDGCLFPSQAVQPQAAMARDTSVGSMRDTEGEVGLEVAGMGKCEQQSQTQVFTGESLVQSTNPTCVSQIFLSLALQQSLRDPRWICFSTLTAAFL